VAFVHSGATFYFIEKGCGKLPDNTSDTSTTKAVLIKVDGETIPQPYVFKFNVMDISSSDAGRTEDTIMHKNRVGQKRKISLAWRCQNPDDVNAILKAFDPEYFQVTYPDMLEGKTVTKTFYSGDKAIEVYMWTLKKKIINTISFDIIEQ